MRSKFLFLLPVFIALVSAASITSCQAISSPGTYTLQNDLTGVISGQSVCLQVDTENVTIDCVGFAINNDGTANAMAINTSANNLTVANCKINHYDKAINVDGTSISRLSANLSYNYIYNVSSGGIYINYADNVTVYNNTIINATIFGIDIRYPSNVTLANNTLINVTTASNQYAISLTNGDADSGDNVRVENNTLRDIYWVAMRVQSTSSNHLQSPVIFNNKVEAFEIKLSSASYAVSYASNLNFSFNVFNRTAAAGQNYMTLSYLDGTLYFYNNTFNNLSNGGVQINSGPTIAYIYNNTFVNGGDSGGIGAAIKTYAPSIVEDNYIENLTSRGLWITSPTVAASSQVRRNYFKNLSYAAAIYSYCADSSIIEDNTFINLKTTSTDAVSLQSGSNTLPCIIRNNTVDGAYRGIYMALSSNQVSIENNTIRGVQHGIYGQYSNSGYATIKNNTIINTTSSSGFGIFYQGNGLITENELYNHTGHGIKGIGGSGKQVNITYNYIYNVSRYGVQLDQSDNGYIAHNFINLSPTSNNYVALYITSSDNVISTNNTVKDAVASTAYGFRLNYAHNITFDNSTFSALDGRYGALMQNSQNGTFKNITFEGPWDYGMYISTNTFNDTFDNITVAGAGTSIYVLQNGNLTFSNLNLINSTVYGIYLYPYLGNFINVSNITINALTGDGIYVQASTNTTIKNATVSGAKHGMLLANSASAENITVVDSKFYNNSIADIRLYKSSVTSNNFNFTNITLDNPEGNMKNYSIIDFYDAVVNKVAINISWNLLQFALPTNTLDPINSSFNISAQLGVGGTIDIDALKVRWDDASLPASADESKFMLYKYDAGTWTKLNDTPETTLNELSAYNINSLSTFALLQDATDTTPPFVDYGQNTPANESNVSGSVLLNGTATDPNLDTIEIFIDNTKVKSCTTSPCEYTWDTTSYADGDYIINVTANDTAGNLNFSERYLTVDNTPPTISLELPTPANNSVISGSIILNFSADDPRLIKVIEIFIDNTKVKSCTTSPCEYTWDTTSYAEGDHEVNVTANDTLDNLNWTAYNYSVDLTVPFVDFISPTPSNGTFTTDQVINVTASDVHFKNVSILVNNTEVKTCTALPCEYTLSGVGEYYINATAYDTAGNKNTTELLNINISAPPAPKEESKPKKKLTISSTNVVCPENILEVKVKADGKSEDGIKVILKNKDTGESFSDTTNDEGIAEFEITESAEYSIRTSSGSYEDDELSLYIDLCPTEQEQNETSEAELPSFPTFPGEEQPEASVEEPPPVSETESSIIISESLPSVVIRAPENAVPGESFEVFVNYANGTPAEGIEVSAVGPEEVSSITDEKGSATFVLNTPGTYTFTSELPIKSSSAIKVGQEEKKQEYVAEVPLKIEETKPVVIKPKIDSDYVAEVYVGSKLITKAEGSAGKSVRVVLPKGEYKILVKAKQQIKGINIELESNPPEFFNISLPSLAGLIALLLIIFGLLVWLKKRRKVQKINHLV